MSINKKLQKQIISMVKKDQLIRKRQWQEFRILDKKFSDKSNPKYKKRVSQLVAQLKNLDSLHTNRMREIIKKYGWPGKNLVGKKVAQMTWLLVQHADHDVSFQESCLKLLKKAVARGEAEFRHIAFLTDRILIHKGKKQIYGTQFTTKKDGTPVPFPIKNIKTLNKKREQIGLEHFSVYTKKIKGIYKKIVPSQSN